MIGAADRDRFVASTAGIEFWPTTPGNPALQLERHPTLVPDVRRPIESGIGHDERLLCARIGLQREAPVAAILLEHGKSLAPRLPRRMAKRRGLAGALQPASDGADALQRFHRHVIIPRSHPPPSTPPAPPPPARP